MDAKTPQPTGGTDAGRLSRALLDADIRIYLIFILSLLSSITGLAAKAAGSAEPPSPACTAKKQAFARFSKRLIVGIYVCLAAVGAVSYHSSGSRADYIAFIASLIAVIPPVLVVQALSVAQREKNSVNPAL